MDRQLLLLSKPSSMLSPWAAFHPPVPINLDAGWASKPIWSLWRKVSLGNRTTFPLSFSPLLSRCSDKAIPSLLCKNIFEQRQEKKILKTWHFPLCLFLFPIGGKSSMGVNAKINCMQPSEAWIRVAAWHKNSNANSDSCSIEWTNVCSLGIGHAIFSRRAYQKTGSRKVNPLNPELNHICYLLALLGAYHFLHVSRIRVRLLTFRLLMSYIYIYIYIYIYDISRLRVKVFLSRVPERIKR